MIGCFAMDYTCCDERCYDVSCYIYIYIYIYITIGKMLRVDMEIIESIT